MCSTSCWGLRSDAVETFKDVTIACKLLKDRQEGINDVTYAYGKFHYHAVGDDGTPVTWVKTGRLTKKLISTTLLGSSGRPRRTPQVQAAMAETRAQHLHEQERECAMYEGYVAARRTKKFSSGGASEFLPSSGSSHSDDNEESLVDSAKAPSYVASNVVMEPEPESSFALAMLKNTEYAADLKVTEVRRTVYLDDDDRAAAMHEARKVSPRSWTSGGGLRFQKTKGDSTANETLLNDMLDDLKGNNAHSKSWEVATPTSKNPVARARYKAICAQREYMRNMGILAPQTARTAAAGSWLELEPLILNRLARKGSYFQETMQLRDEWHRLLTLAEGDKSPHTKLGSLETLIDEWILMLREQASIEEKTYPNDDAMLDDLELARNAGPAKTLLALAIVKRDYNSFIKGGLGRPRFHLASSVGLGSQGREGGKVKKDAEGFDPNDIRFDVNGPRHLG